MSHRVYEREYVPAHGSGIGGAVYLVIGVLVAVVQNYFDHLSTRGRRGAEAASTGVRAIGAPPQRQRERGQRSPLALSSRLLAGSKLWPVVSAR